MWWWRWEFREFGREWTKIRRQVETKTNSIHKWAAAWTGKRIPCQKVLKSDWEKPNRDESEIKRGAGEEGISCTPKFEELTYFVFFIILQIKIWVSSLSNSVLGITSIPLLFIFFSPFSSKTEEPNVSAKTFLSSIVTNFPIVNHREACKSRFDIAQHGKSRISVDRK